MGDRKTGLPVPEGARLAIVGAGPAGCLLAIALLDAARARRRSLQISLFHGGGERPRGRMVLDEAALAALSSAGLPLPSLATVPMAGIRTVVGRQEVRQPLALFAAPRGGGSEVDLVAMLRDCARGRGATLVPSRVDEIRPAGGGGYTVRAAGASVRADAVVLACGAGAPIAASVAGHRPPPVWRCCQASLEIDPEVPREEGWLTRVVGHGMRPDLWLLSAEGDDEILAVGEEAGPRQLAEALLGAVAQGRIPPARLLHPRSVFLPAGVAEPGLPTLGTALGGTPEERSFARIAAEAQALAAAFFEGGAEAMLERSRAEALRLGTRVRRRMRRTRRWRRARPLVERALAREAVRPADRRPIHRTLATASRERRGEGLLLALRTLLALLSSWLLLRWERLRGWSAPPPLPSNGKVFVVDDDADQAEGLCDQLAHLGIEAIPFADGMAAVAAAARERPAAVILDVALPWVDGPTVCRSLRQEADLPVFLATALPLPLVRRQAIEAGATAILSKPIDLPSLVGRLPPRVRMRSGRPERRQTEGEPADAAQPARDQSERVTAVRSEGALAGSTATGSPADWRITRSRASRA